MPLLKVMNERKDLVNRLRQNSQGEVGRKPREFGDTQAKLKKKKFIVGEVITLSNWAAL